MIVTVVCLLLAAAMIGWLAYKAVMDFVVQPRRDARGRVKHWCSGCDRHDVMRWDMAWTEDHGRWWCRKCRTGSMYPS